MSNNIIQEIVNKLLISEIISEYIDISKKGKNYWAVCPFHEDNNPSMSISDEKKLYKCFSCGNGGNVLNFVSNFEKITFKKSISKLAAKAGIEFNDDSYKPKYDKQQEQIIKVLNESRNYFQYSLTTDEGKDAYEYLKSRNLKHDVLEKYGIGFAPNNGLTNFLISKDFDKALLINASLTNEYGQDFFRNRIVFSIINEFGDVIGFSARLYKGEGPKYINSIESRIFKKSSVFYNINNAKEISTKKREVYICEGFMDVIALDRAGISNVLAVMGTSLTKNHLPFLRNKTVNLMFDYDTAGINASLKSIKLLLENKIKINIINNDKAKDADEILEKFGKDELIKVVENKTNVFDFVFNYYKEKHNYKNPDEIKNLLKDFSQYLKYADSIEKNFYVKKIAKEINMDESLILEYVPNVRKTYSQTKQTIIKNDAPLKVVKPVNHSYVLIISLIKNKELQKYFKMSDVNFYDEAAKRIGKYIESKNKDPNIAKSLKKDVKIIFNGVGDNDSVIINSKDEYEDLVELINMEYDRWSLKSITKGIKENSASEIDEAKLKAIQEFQRKKMGE